MIKSARKIIFDMAFAVEDEGDRKLREQRKRRAFFWLNYIIKSEKLRALIFSPYCYLLILVLLFLFGVLPRWLWAVLLTMAILPILMLLSYVYGIYKSIKSWDSLRERMAKRRGTSKGSDETVLFDLMIKFHEKARQQGSEKTESGSPALTELRRDFSSLLKMFQGLGEPRPLDQREEGKPEGA
jgi:hypothetical protein